MKIRQIIVFMLLWLGLSPAMHAQTFDKEWKEVEVAIVKGQPATVIKLTNELYQKAEREKNSPQMLKAYLYQIKYRNMLTPDSLYTGLKEIEQRAKQTDQPIDRAILHSLLAEAYADYATNNRWELQRRTNIVGEDPDTDMREWTANMFVDKVKTHVREAMADSVLLLKTSSRSYIPFIVLGKTSEYYHHDMYHLLASRSIQALRQIDEFESDAPADSLVEKTLTANQYIERIYDNMLNCYLERGDKEGYVLSALKYINWKYNTNNRSRMPFEIKKGTSVVTTVHPYLDALNALKSKCKTLNICGEVYFEEARYLKDRDKLETALLLCDEAIKLYPNYRSVNSLKNLRQEILDPSLTVNVNNMALPGEEIKVEVSHRNLDGFTLRLYKAGKKVKEQHYSLLRPQDYLAQDTTFTFIAPEIGEYVMRIVPNIRAKKDAEWPFSVTRLKLLNCRLPGDQCEVISLDAQTGHPISNTKVTVYNDEKELLKEVTTGADGKAIFPWNTEYRFFKASKGADTAMPLQGIYSSYGFYGDRENTNEIVEILTDRSLYRPGQTVYVKGIAFTQLSDTANVIPNKAYTVYLTDANDQEVGRKTVRTNEFGSFATDFALPSACLNGMFTIKTEKGRTFIRVEEYKRPTFDITFEKQQGSYKLGDQVQVKGKVQSFSGVLLQDVAVKYTVKRSVYSLWRFMYEKQIASGEVTANENGEFAIPVSLEDDDKFKDDNRTYYRYRIEATVTNAAGETQSSTDVISAGNRSLLLLAELKEVTCKDKPVSLNFNVQNLNGLPVEVEGSYRLFSVKDKERNLLSETPVVTGTFTSNKELTLDWKNIPSGQYMLKASVTDNQGKEVTAEAYTIIFSLLDQRPPIDTPIWYYEGNVEFDAAHPGTFSFGTSFKDAYVIMNVFSGNKMLENKTMILSDSIMHFNYPYQESYGDGLLIAFCTVRDDKIYQQQVRLKKRLPDKTLAMKWEVFRDKLRPGQKEEWKLTIKTPQGKAADAEMLATMYDASLDKIWNRPQGFRLFYDRKIPYFGWQVTYPRNNFFDYWWPSKYFRVTALEYDHFAEVTRINSSLRNALAGSAIIRGVALQRKATVTGALQTVDLHYSPAASADKANGEQGYGSLEAAEEASEAEMLPEAPADLRTNLAETAFFYPQLRTNEQGEISLAFTMPESLTRWNFRGYSHTKGMLTGTLDGVATTSKEFMLTPNLPRFVRVGDKTSIAASISNMTGKPQEGTVNMILFDPMTEKVVSTQKQKFSIAAGKTIGVNFMFTVSDKYEILGCRMIADSGTFSDGEQQLLPVLSNKEHLTETLPMPIRGEETRTFSLDDLFNHHSKTATDRKLTVEFTGNPAWYAIQALPSLSLPESNNAIAWATTYYANSLASYIMNSQPRIKAVFDSWKLQGGTKETFLSNLQKNQDVKNILLSESPWVLEAQTEEQQKERIATLFDLNNISSNNMAALTRLKELQKSSGAWSWYKGMNGSRYVTAYIAELNARLAMLTGEKLTGTALAMQKNAFTYLHKSALEEYNNILKAQKEGTKFTGVSGSILQYLYLIAISGEQVPAANKGAYAYFLSKVNEMLSTTAMDTKAIAAIVLDNAGRKKEAQEFVTSIKEYLTKTDEQGMFFAFNENPYSWGGMKLQAHVDVMEALNLLGGNNETVEELKLWLLKQKQTQQWNSPVATADAVYALLMNGTNLLDNQGDVRISIADEVVETVSPGKTTVPGLGYVKRSFTEKKVVNAREIKVEKRNPGIAWGAVYAQYESPISDVKQQGGELNIDKQLYVERMVNNKAQLQPITEKTVLKVGDKVVSRLSIRTDRTMDFVQLKDQRGACFEPIGSISGYIWNRGFGYYVDIKDAATNFFFDHLGKGVYVMEYSYRVSRAGTYETGLATMQCAYAPEYASHSASTKVTVVEE